MRWRAGTFGDYYTRRGEGERVSRSPMDDSEPQLGTTSRARVLAARLLSAVGEASAKDLAMLADLEDILQKLLDAGRAAWPSLDLSDDDFLKHIGERLTSAPDAPRALLAIHAGDLFLACACAHGSE